MDKILTITIPTYNVEKYLRNCLDSFCNEQIMDCIEVLIINDGSTDSSAEIAKEYEAKYPETFRLITKQNGGHGSTINRGIAEAKGKYFKVVDSDDWVDRNAFQTLVETLKKSTADLVYANYYWVDHTSGKKSIEFRHPFSGVEYGKEYTFSEIAQKVFLKMHGFTVLTDIIRKIPKIDENCFYVDMEYVLFPIKNIRTVVFLDEFVYHYRIGLPGQSMDMAKMQRNAENFDRVMKRVLEYYDDMKKENVEEYYLCYAQNLIARLLASRMKIFLSYPCSRKVQKDMMQYDNAIKAEYPKIYHAVIQPAVKWMRRTGYLAYYPARVVYYWKERYSNAKK